MAKVNNLEPKPYWGLSDYMQAVENCLNDRMVQSHEDKNAYAVDVIYRLKKTELAIANLRKFMKDQKIT